jgi:hypothetical protein
MFWCWMFSFEGFFSCNFFNFWIRIGCQPKMLDQDPESMNPDPEHWFFQ